MIRSLELGILWNFRTYGIKFWKLGTWVGKVALHIIYSLRKIPFIYP